MCNSIEYVLPIIMLLLPITIVSAVFAYRYYHHSAIALRERTKVVHQLNDLVEIERAKVTEQRYYLDELLTEAQEKLRNVAALQAILNEAVENNKTHNGANNESN